MNKTEQRRFERVQNLMAFDKAQAAQQLLLNPDFAGMLSLNVVAGMDEAGRGPLAGPVVAACVIMPETPALLWVDDSKKLSESRRELVYEEIIGCAAGVGVGLVSAAEIDRINILEATRKAMRQAASMVTADLYLIDAVTGLGLNGMENAVIKGDALSYSIAAASIVAKVTRDRLMRELDAKYPQYSFAANKGYGTAAHIDALRSWGPCPEHRRTFITHFVEAASDA